MSDKRISFFELDFFVNKFKYCLKSIENIVKLKLGIDNSK